MKRPQSMTDDAKSSLTPKLRFPEFRDGPGWTGSPMGEVYSFKGNNSLSRDQLNYEHGSVKNVHYGDIHTKFSTLFDIIKESVPFINPSESLDGLRHENNCIEGDIIFADASEDMEDIGKSIEIVRLNGERVVSGQHTILARPSVDSLAVGFGAYLFKSKYVRTQIQKEAQGSKVLGISAARLTKIQLPIPRAKAEQQKIAECLSTLDELIGAESQKLDALKAHKKGLMQQLFPREGETVPRLRFPEFQNAPEWEEARIGAKCESFSGGTPSTSQKAFYGGTIPFIRSAEIARSATELFLTEVGLQSSAAKLVKKGDVLVALYGANSGDVALAKIDGAINQAILCLRPESDRAFLYHFLSLKKDWIVDTYIQGGQGNLSGEIVKSISLCFPRPEEQLRIATCLSSFDDLIAAQNDKLEALKTHKKGLMQQLFPSPPEAEE